MSGSEAQKLWKYFAKYAQELKLDVKAFTDSVSKNEFKDAINKDRSDGQASELILPHLSLLTEKR